jgi:XTP/dITP diphosphohydrolase
VVTDHTDQTRKWEALKAKEKEHAKRRSIVDGVPKAMPALYRARRVLSKAAAARFTWAGKAQAWAKFEEELFEFREAVNKGGQADKEEELGDLLTALVNVARFEKIDPEASLHAGVRKLTRRIEGVEALAHAKGRKITDLEEAELLALWGEVKKGERKKLSASSSSRKKRTPSKARS